MSSEQVNSGGRGPGQQKGGGLGTPLLPSKGVQKAGTPVIHQEKRPGTKRSRVETSSPQKELTGTDWHKRIEDDVNWVKGKIGTAALGLKSDKIISLADSMREFLNVTLVEIYERQASTQSDMCTEIGNLVSENEKLRGKLTEQKEDIDKVKQCKEKVEVKASRKDMEEKVKHAVTQVKVTNLDLGKFTDDRRELTTIAKAALSSKVRYDSKIRAATFRVLSSKTFKSMVDGKEIWTAPVLVTIPEKENRWDVENCLRKSKLFPSFHWPREMVDNVKKFRQVVRNMGYSDQTHFIRIRPEERDGSWRIRADVKQKDSDARFVSVASFDIPPLDESLKISCAGWEKPVWTRPTPAQPRDQESHAEDFQMGDEQEDEDEITAEDIMYRM
jgi:hypothetical protein